MQEIRHRDHNLLPRISEVDEMSVLSISENSEDIKHISAITRREAPKKEGKKKIPLRTRDAKNLRIQKDGVFDEYGDRVDLENLRGFDKNDVFNNLLIYEEQKALDEEFF